MRTLAVVALLLAACPAPAAAPAPPPGAVAALRSFLQAFAARDHAALQALTPTDPARAIGPSPFADVPRLGQVIVEGDYAVARVDGRSAAGPDRQGVLLLRRTRDAEAEPGESQAVPRPLLDRMAGWRVRYYLRDDNGAVLRGAAHDETAAERRQHDAVSLLVRTWFHAWCRPAPDYHAMQALRCDPWVFRRGAPRATVTALDIVDWANTPAGCTITFSATARKYGLFHRHLRGIATLFPHNATWLVRMDALW